MDKNSHRTTYTSRIDSIEFLHHVQHTGGNLLRRKESLILIPNNQRMPEKRNISSRQHFEVWEQF